MWFLLYFLIFFDHFALICPGFLIKGGGFRGVGGLGLFFGARFGSMGPCPGRNQVLRPVPGTQVWDGSVQNNPRCQKPFKNRFWSISWIYIVLFVRIKSYQFLWIAGVRFGSMGPVPIPKLRFSSFEDWILDENMSRNQFFMVWEPKTGTNN